MFIITHKKIFLSIAAIITVVSIGLIATLGLRLGIDFTGGSLTEVSYSQAPEKAVLEETVRTSVADLGEFSVRASVNENNDTAYLIRTRDLNEEERAALSESVVALGEGTVDRFTSIGPVIGQELRDKALYAILAVIAIIVIYVAFAFRGIGTPVSAWTYGVATIIVLVHDVLVPTAMMSVLGYVAGVEVDTLFIMAILAVLGYSVNDTIVIFDRVRENLVANRVEKRTMREEAGIMHEDVTYSLTKPYEEIVGSAVVETLARSINTSLTTFVALVALYFFGGDVTQTFALVLMAGVVAGAYSSIFIASPLVVAYAERKANTVE